MVVAAGVVAATLAVPATPTLAAVTRQPRCVSRILVLSAYPAELDAVLARAKFNVGDEVVIDGRSFFPGRIGRHRVVMAMTGIGPRNADATAQLAMEQFRCGGAPSISAVVFSGVAGSSAFLGDVIVPTRWTGDDGQTWTPADASMLETARRVAASGRVPLSRDVNPIGDPLCACSAGTVPPAIRLGHEPVVRVGGDGVTTDPFGGRTFPCVPFGGDIFGCRPCRAGVGAPDPLAFVTGILPFIPGFFIDYLSSPEASATTAGAADNESAAVASVAAEHGRPFIAFRGVSDGEGDQLMLPGFPVQFFAYQSVAAHNAAAATATFLRAWSAP
jgi:nucleoside phosphorylase